MSEPDVQLGAFSSSADFEVHHVKRTFWNPDVRPADRVAGIEAFVHASTAAMVSALICAAAIAPQVTSTSAAATALTVVVAALCATLAAAFTVVPAAHRRRQVEGPLALEVFWYDEFMGDNSDAEAAFADLHRCVEEFAMLTCTDHGHLISDDARLAALRLRFAGAAAVGSYHELFDKLSQLSSTGPAMSAMRNRYTQRLKEQLAVICDLTAAAERMRDAAGELVAAFDALGDDSVTELLVPLDAAEEVLVDAAAHADQMSVLAAAARDLAASDDTSVSAAELAVAAAVDAAEVCRTAGTTVTQARSS